MSGVFPCLSEGILNLFAALHCFFHYGEAEMVHQQQIFRVGVRENSRKEIIVHTGPILLQNIISNFKTQQKYFLTDQTGY